MISVNNLTKRFRALPVLNDLSLSFGTGTATAIIGPNGSGKTTLMKCILGLVTPTHGSIVINGVNAVGNAASRKDLGYMSQIARFPDNLTPHDVIGMVKGLRKGHAPTSEEELIDLIELRAHTHKPMRALSGGSRQKVSAVIALMFAPSVLLLDEPTAGLDPIASGSLKHHILGIKEHGGTVLITSHILSDVEELADRIVFLHEGSVVYDGTMPDLLALTSESNLERAIAVMMQSPTLAPVAGVLPGPLPSALLDVVAGPSSTRKMP